MADTLVINANVRVNRSRGGNDELIEEVFVTSVEPYVNFRFNLEGDHVGKIQTGEYEVHFKKPIMPVSTKADKSA